MRYFFILNMKKLKYPLMASEINDDDVNDVYKNSY